MEEAIGRRVIEGANIKKKQQKYQSIRQPNPTPQPSWE